MTPEQLVPSRETCERMKVAGWTKPTLFAYGAGEFGRAHVRSGGALVELSAESGAMYLLPRSSIAWAAAAAEIADELVGRVGPGWELPYWPEPHGHGGWFWMDGEGEIIRTPTLTEALAALWMALNEKEKR